MHFVAARGQFHAQFRGHDAGAAIGRIAGDSDFHVAAVWPWAGSPDSGANMLYHGAAEAKFSESLSYIVIS